ncbi:hypothetical protein LTR04_002392, partial [Oleoguttula sp. CCFEE 6159]
NPFVRKARMALNYKKLDYKTEWLEYPDVAPTLKSLGVPPNDPGSKFAYSIPVIRLDEKTFVMDSREIADALEKHHPSPSLRLDSPILPKVEAIIGRAMMPLAGVVMPRIPKQLLSEPSEEYFERTRAARFGMSLAQFEKEKGGDGAWEAAKPAIEEMAELLKKEGGPYFMGKTVSYADFVVVSLLQFLKRTGDDLYERMVAYDPAYSKLYEACAEWLARAD